MRITSNRRDGTAPDYFSRRLLSRVAEIDFGILVTLVVYLGWYSFLIIDGRGVPYVMDNNETFSALNHAYNLWNFDFFRSFGLTDEAASPDPSAHPVVHTHQGNFPRLFAFILFALGARTAESQVWLTTITVGSAAIAMAYLFFRRLSGKLFATTVLILLMTDYMMFAQWQVNTYRIWHGFLLFAALLCVHGFGEWRRWQWAGATIFTYTASFYWELIFAAFLSITVALYAIWTYRHRPRSFLLIGVVQGCGAALGLSTLILQLILFLGWNDFLTDFRLTLTARNDLPEGAEFIALLRQFYETRNIVFVYNVQPKRAFADIIEFSQLLFRFVFQTATPFLSLLALGMATASFCWWSGHSEPRRKLVVSRYLAITGVAALVPGVFILIFALAAGDAVLGLPFHRRDGETLDVPIILCCLAMAVAIATGLRSCARRLSQRGLAPGVGRCACGGIFFIGLGALIIVQSELYDQNAAALWWRTLTLFPAWFAKLLVAAVAVVASMIILAGRRAVLGRWHQVPSALGPFILCGVLGYAIVYALASGYVYSGYLIRFSPLMIFHVEALIALGLFVAIATAITMVEQLRRDFHQPLTWTVGFASGFVALIFAGAWFFVQSRYFLLVPPDRLAFIRLLERPEFRGHGLISNTYAAPFGYVAQTWAFLEPDPDRPANSWYHIWFADRRKNIVYQRPQLYVCFEAPWNYYLLMRTVHPGLPGVGCSHDPMVRRASSQQVDPSIPKATILARDLRENHWAILRLEWPPLNNERVRSMPGNH